MEIKDVMSSNIVVGNINDDIFTLANIMKENDIGFLPIVDGNKVVGVITDRDIVINIVSNNDCKINGYLRNVISVDINDSFEHLLDIFSTNKIKRVIVSDNNLMVGIVSISDILDYDVLDTIRTIFSIDRHKHFNDVPVDLFYL